MNQRMMDHRVPGTASVPSSAPPDHLPAPAVHVSGLTVVRGAKTVLSGVSAVVGRGSVLGLLGPSGSGKTTLLRTIVGVQRFQEGTVNVLGAPVGSAQLRREIGYVTQAPSVYGDLTVEQNVTYFASLLGMDRADVAHVMNQVGLSRQAGQLVGELSGGQRSRCSLACALVGRPSILVLDEPTAGQDPLLREQLWDLFRGLADAGVTLIVSSHVMAEAARCDQLLLIREGRVAAAGTPDELRARTGADDMDQVFLTLAQEQEVSS